MINFPFFQHYAIKIVFQKTILIDENLIDEIANLIIVKFKLNVVNKGRHEFTNNGFTKFWVLSQSHLVIHTWPEKTAMHIDLMTCTSLIHTEEEIKRSLSSLPIKEIVVVDHKY